MGNPEQLSPYLYEQEPKLTLVKPAPKKETAEIFEFPREKIVRPVTIEDIKDVFSEEGYQQKYQAIEGYIKSGYGTFDDFHELLAISSKSIVSQLAVFANIHNFSNPEELKDIFSFSLYNTVDFLDNHPDDAIFIKTISSEDISPAEIDEANAAIPVFKDFLDYNQEKKESSQRNLFTTDLYFEVLFDEMQKVGSASEDVMLKYLREIGTQKNDESNEDASKYMTDEEYLEARQTELETGDGFEEGQVIWKNEKEETFPDDEEGDNPGDWDKDSEGDLRDRVETAEFYDLMYLERKSTLDFLAKNGSEKSIDFVAEFLQENSRAVFLYKNQLADILSRFPEYGAEKLFEVIDQASKTKDSDLHKDALKLLCRIELGRIGISEEGIKYFEGLYDVGEFNNSQYFAQRLTGDGKIGIFDDQRILQRYFDVSQTAGKRGLFQPHLLEMTHEVLFAGKATETVEEKLQRQQYLQEFQEGYFDFYENEFFEKTGIKFNNLSFREQGWFLLANKHSNESEQAKLLQFAKKFGENGLKTFLSLEFDAEMGDRILAIADSELLQQKDVTQIFASYSRIIDFAEDVQHEVENIFLKKEFIESTDLENIRLELFVKSRKLLISFFEKIENGEEINGKEVMTELEHFRTDIVFFTSVFKNFAKNNPEASFEDFKGLSLETKKGNDFNDSDISKMISIVRKNYQEDEAMQKLVVESLQEGLQKENAEFFVLRRDGEIVAFDRFDDEGEYFYVGSFNVDAGYRGSAIGEVMMQESFDRKAKEKPLQGITDPKKIICSKYVEDGKFIVDEILRTPVNEKILTEVNILRDDNINQTYEYRAGQRLMDLNLVYAQQHSADVKKRRSEKLRNRESFLLKFDKKTEMNKFENLAERLIEEYGYVITRYLPADKNGETMMVAFEQKLG